VRSNKSESGGVNYGECEPSLTWVTSARGFCG